MPSAASGPAFRVEEAFAAGHTDWSTRSARMLMPTRGVRSIDPIRDTSAAVGAFALALPSDVVFSHTTAARLWGLWLPRRLQGEHGLHVMRATGRPPIERSGCVPHRGLERREIVEQDGVRVTSLADTWLDLIEAFYPRLTLSDAIMLGDAAVERMAPTKWVDELHPSAAPTSSQWWVDPANRGPRDLRARLIERRTFRGRRMAREAMRFVRPRVWSAMESYSRSVIVHAELPEPQLNASIHFPDGGGFIGFADLAWGKRDPARNKVVGEYQGRQVHDEDEPSRVADNDRCLLMRDAGWTVLEIYSKDVTTAGGRLRLVHRLRGLLA